MSYVDGFVLPIPADKIEAYRKMAKSAGERWMEHGALAFRECVAEDTSAEGMVPFPKLAGASANEVVIFSYIVFKSREHRDEVNKRVMDDPRIKQNIDEFGELFDCKRMAYGGFNVLVDL
ncbi:DUF1428 domain-containing protein [Legionella taurinensis]|uniref:DUF1428 domain-containing protein n=1 Tax=Legionella taurinensis TaxID=70611 RepID=A0A3A5LJG9_9GAMM|nr:DUF1428 domain-containing protein [Legionella taurinensis]MDX1837036.1 DUF1428 domain-containing protein [Legionella taurinensis]PUT41440.1 DUF1428 domain-containing protein [Legionella taurinensis]PUT42679.1 DUF1428 domain-containing protein [Legionella taurinensis]PUT46707.1 DUF1428 domain-containing protein [Legionella taurinensis]PUT47356.1 DUF1428 domain-containing protein [Legionella taurinensis]